MFSKQGRSKVSSVLIFALLFSLLLPAFAWGATTVQLKDIADSYAQKEIQSLIDSGVISGYEDGTFQPRKAMSRAELAKIIVVSLGLKENPDQAAVFTDVDKNSWYRGFVGALVDSKITQGTSATTFAPEAKVTREELVVFFVRAMGLETAAGKVAVDAKLSDLAQVSSWAQAHVSLAFKVGFVQGIENADKTLKFSPKDNSERQALARLAYEFKTNKSTFITKANELAGISPISSAKATANTTVEVTFSQDVATVAAADFTFDGGLTVSKAELKADTKNIVVLTTSLQNLNTTYKLSYKGKDTGITITGAGFSGGGSSGGGAGGTYSNNNDTDMVKIMRPGTYGNLTLSQSGTFGPPDGYGVAKVGTLTLNPGPNGEITLQNIEADNVIVASGSKDSIKLRNTIIIKLTISTGSQAGPVRIESLFGAKITTTYLESQAVIEATYGGFGTINIGAGASGKDVELRGNVTGAVYVTDQVNVAVKIKIGAPKGGGTTTVANLNLGGNAALTTDAGQTVSALNVTAPNITVSVAGPGAITQVTATATAIGVTLSLGADSNIQAITLFVVVILSGDSTKIAFIISIVVIAPGSNGGTTTPDRVATPTASVASGAVAAGTQVTLSTATGSADIYYTTDGSTPSASSTPYTGAITINTATTVKAIAVKTGMINSATATFAYTITSPTSPTLSSIASTPSSVSFTTYTTQQLAITATYSDSTTTTVTSGASYSSSDTAVATVSNAGVVTAVGNGTATITVTYDGKTASVTVTVSVTVTPSVTTVTYVTYNTSASVTGSVYSGAGTNSVGSPFHIAAGNASDFLIVGFSDDLSTIDFGGITFTSNGTAATATYTIIDTVYAAFKYNTPRVPGAYELKFDGLKKKVGGSAYDTVTIHVYQD
jgi:hypothetical protein